MRGGFPRVRGRMTPVAPGDPVGLPVPPEEPRQPAVPPVSPGLPRHFLYRPGDASFDAGRSRTRVRVLRNG